jgi:V8-like Glu-specific endopeptidase
MRTKMLRLLVCATVTVAATFGQAAATRNVFATPPPTSEARTMASALQDLIRPGWHAERWTDNLARPGSTVGRLIVIRGSVASLCTATVVRAENKSTIWTAAHCLAEHGSPISNDTTARFLPGVDGTFTPFGSFESKSMAIPPEWVTSGSRDSEFDFGIVTLHPNVNGDKVEDLTGGQEIVFAPPFTGTEITTIGYPNVGIPPRSDFGGNRAWWCDGTTLPGGPFLKLACDMGDGASGAPWLRGMDANGIGTIVGNTIGPLECVTVPFIASPKYGPEAALLFEQHQGTSVPAPVPAPAAMLGPRFHRTSTRTESVLSGAGFTR